MSPKTKEQFKEIRNQSKASIQAAALELFGKQGYANTSISQIAKAAGISKGLMYNYFESKEVLLREILLAAFGKGENLMETSLLQQSAPKEQLLAIIEGAFYLVRSQPQYWKLLTTLAFQPEIAGEIEWATKHKREGNLELIKNILAQLGVKETEKEAYLMGAALDGILMQYFFLGDAYPLEDMKKLFIERFCNY